MLDFLGFGVRGLWVGIEVEVEGSRRGGAWMINYDISSIIDYRK